MIVSCRLRLSYFNIHYSSIVFRLFQARSMFDSHAGSVLKPDIRLRLSDKCYGRRTLFDFRIAMSYVQSENVNWCGVASAVANRTLMGGKKPQIRGAKVAQVGRENVRKNGRGMQPHKGRSGENDIL